MFFSDEKIKKLANALTIVLSLFGICSLIIFIPQLRVFIISLIEKIIGRPITHETWHERIINYEISFLLLLAPSLFILFLKGKPECQLFNDNNCKVLSWTLISAICVFLLAIASQSDALWLDETFSLGMARHNVKKLVSLTAQDFHPPLYFLILRIAVLLFPDSVTAARITSTIPIILTLLSSHAFFSKEFSYKHGVFFNLIFLSSISVMSYAFELRMYSWSLFFCALCCITSYYIIREGKLKFFLLYVFFAECGAYCHYWTAVGLAINYLLTSALCAVKNKQTIKNALISAAIGVVLYIPWARVVISQAKEATESYWIPPITIKDFLGYMTSIIPMNGIFKIIMSPILAYCFVKCIKKIREKPIKITHFIICLATPIFLILCATVISIIIKPVFQSKYVFPLSIFVVFFAVFTFIEFNVNKKALYVLFIFCFLCSFQNMKKAFIYEKDAQRDNIAFKKLMNENLTDNTVFIFGKNVDTHIPLCLAFLYPNNKMIGIELTDAWADTIFYDRKNLIKDYNGQNDLCLVINQDEEPSEEFKNVDYAIARVDIHSPVKFYFKK